MKRSRPVLRYHGGKWKLAPWIVSTFPKHRVYVEPFGGAASVLMHKARSYAEVYNDLDGEIVNVFRVLRDPSLAFQLREQLRLTPFARDEFLGAYQECDDQIEAARRTVIKSFMGFGSAAITGGGRGRTICPTGFRPCSNRSGSTPSHDWVNYPNHIEAFVDRLQGVVIENKDYASVLTQHDSTDTLFFIDPPYVHSTRGTGHKFINQRTEYRHELSDDDHEALSERLRALDGMAVLSGYECDLYSSLYRGWAKLTKSSHADGARDRVECLWLNPAACEVQPSLLEVPA